ncbi:MAG: carbohydrate kinase [Firmicutes bacterium HGW-Firmicutes-9]|nr:MAG: carbohydrate kinase [Firmicutes bacterium HGW-Firmicutes-9]
MSQETCLLGIDIGTSAAKLVVFSEDGKALASRAVSYTTQYLQPGYVEQNPDSWWEAVCVGIREMLAEDAIRPAQIAGIGIDGQGWSAIAMDAQGNVLAPDPIWLDTRAESICDELNAHIGEDAIFALSGNPLKAQYVTAKILWLQRNLPQAYAKTKWIMQSNGFIAYRLTGSVSMDISQAYGLHCFDMKNGRMDQAMCKELGIEPGIIPDIVACHKIVGHVHDEAARLTGLLAGTPVVAGGLDAACSTLGAGVLRAGQTQEQGGQAGGMSICIDQYCADKRLILGYHVVPNHWLLQGGTTGGGGAMRWFEREFADFERRMALEKGGSSFAFLDALAEKVPAGSEGVVFLPYLAGERSPIWDSDAQGVYFGLDYSKTRAHMVRALMEGVAFSLKHNLEIAESVGAHVETLRATGGSANSRLWTQIKADVTGKDIEVPESDLATPLGAALLAGVGVGVYPDFETATARTVHVKRTQTHSVQDASAYEQGYTIYRMLYEQLKDIMKQNRRARV